ncbi:uncharacterized protein LOC110464286 [Mizuhopecten yessoensis]|uniref:Vertnin n=1 Tax=Mizuhopecten yessoensis TaxID=6573 RepID=A0A210PUC2_MIZYE|nr:uncharacterized protein LOC110464286 [Mizuhopecten yessoensis]XP_021375094.1 uncharacterized protein LOC110464286 [Mizuhopecten yessoensis]OWF40046.1 Vertnin [Mizuhopecten yessoensis]
MVNNSERSKQWRNKRKNDPKFLENERKRKQASRKNRTEEQRKRDKELCKARQKKYREKKRKPTASSEDITDDQISDSSDVSEPVLGEDGMDTDSISSITRSQDPVSLSSVSKAVDNRSSSKCGQSSEFCDQVHRSEDDNVVVTLKVSHTSGSVVVSDHDLQPNENGENKNNLKPLNDVEATTRSTRSRLQHPDFDSSYACGKLTSGIGVVQTQVSFFKTVDGNSSRLPSSILASSNGVLHGEDEDRRSVSVVSNSDSSSDDMEGQVESASEQPKKSASETGMGKAGKVKRKPEQPIESASETSSCISGNVIGISEQGNGHVFEADTDIVGNMEGSAAQPNESASNTCTGIVRHVDDKANQLIESASEPGTCKAGNVENIPEQANKPTSEPPVEADTVMCVNVSVPTEELSTGSLDERHMAQSRASTHSSLTGKKTTKWIQQYAEGENHEVVSFLTNDITYHVDSQREAFFVRWQRVLSQIADFDELKSRSGEVFREIEKRYPIPAMQTLRLSGHQRDVTAISLYPQDAPRDHVPIQIVGDGNCLPRVGSLFAFGNEMWHLEIRVRIFIELCLFEDTYLNDSYLNRGLETNKQTKSTATLIAQYSDVFTKDVQDKDRDKYVYRVNAKNVLHPGSYNGMWSVFALASVIGVGVRSIYPDYGGYNVREDHNRMVIPRVSRNNDTVIHIMWTNTLGKQPLATAWTPNHFVAVVHKSIIDDTLLGANGGTSEERKLEQLMGFIRTGAYDTERLGLARTLTPQTIARFTIRENNIVTPSRISYPTQRPLIGGPTTENKDTCLSHPSEKPVYLCNTCKGRPICYKCPLERHKNHEYEDLEQHLKKKENEYLKKALQKRNSVLHTELKRQKDVNERCKENIAREIDERVTVITQQLQIWRQQCRQKLQDDAQAIHNNIELSTVRVSATIPTYLRNVQQQVRQLNMAERLARMSEEPPPDVAVNTNPCTSIQFTPGNDDQLIQQFGSLSCHLPDPIDTSAGDRTTNNVLEGDNTFSDVCNSLPFHPLVQSVQPCVLMNTSDRTATKTLDIEDMSDEITTSRALPSCSTSIVAGNINLKQCIDAGIGSFQNKPTPSKRLRVMQNVVINTEQKQKLGRRLETSPNESVINKCPRPCTVPIVSATKDEEKKKDKQCTNMSSSILNTRAGPTIIDNTAIVQQLDRPNMVVSPNLTGHQIDVNPRLTCIQSSGIGSPVRPMSIKSCSETQVSVGQMIISSPAPTGSSGIQSSDEHSTRVEINQVPRTTQTLGGEVTIPDNVITSQPRTTDKVITATCLARAQPCGILDSRASSYSFIREQKKKSIRPSRTTATTQQTSNELSAGGRLIATGSRNSRKKTDQISARQPREYTRMEFTSATGLKMVIRSANTAKYFESSPRAKTAVNGACAINTTIVAGTTPTVNTNVEKTIKKTNEVVMIQKPDWKDDMASTINTTNTVVVTSPVNVVSEIKTTTTVGTATLTNVNFTVATNSNSAMETTASRPKTNMNVSGATKNTCAEKMTIVKANQVVKAANVAGTTRTEHVAGTSPKTSVYIEGPRQINDTVQTTPSVNHNDSKIIKTVSAARPSPVANKNDNGTTKVTNAVETAPKMANKNTSGAIKAVSVATTSPIAKINVNGSMKITNGEETIPKPNINFTGATDTLNGAKTTSLANTIVDCSTKITHPGETTLVVNKNAAGTLKAVNVARSTSMSNINVDGTTKITNAVGTTRKPYMKFTGSTQTTKVVEPTSLANTNVDNATKIARSAETTPMRNRNVNKTSITPMSNINVNGKTKITQTLGTAPMVDKSDTGTIKSVNIPRSTPMPNRNRSTKIRNAEGTTPESYINFTGAATTTKVANKKVDCSTEITIAEGTIPKPYINITGETKTANEADLSSAAIINVITTTKNVNVAKPTHRFNITTTGPNSGNHSKRKMSTLQMMPLL